MFSPHDYHASSPYALSNFMQKIYCWMTSGLLTTALIAHALYSNKVILMQILSFKYSMLILFLAQLGLVGYLSLRIHKMSYTAAVVTFFMYAASVGITLAPIFFVYQLASIGMVFSITASMFAVMATYGYFTRSDLSRLGNILFMGLIGIIVASLASLYFKNSMAELVISYIGVLVFTGLIAYDVQKMKWLFHAAQGDQELENKISIIGALSLYLDFINLFIMLLRIFGARKND